MVHATEMHLVTAQNCNLFQRTQITATTEKENAGV